MVRIGQKIHCDLEGGRDGVVYAINNKPRTITFPTLGFRYTASNGDTTYDIVFADGSEARNVPESALAGPSWHVHSSVADEAEVQAMRDFAADKQARDAAQAKAKIGEFAAVVATVRADPKYGHLRQAGGCAFGARLALINIRRELKRDFPDTEFSVAPEDRDSLSVRWSGGPASDAVEAITGHYENGYESSPWAYVFGSAARIFLSRGDSFAAMPGVSTESALSVAA